MDTISDYPGTLTIKEALPVFFDSYQLGPDGGMSDRWVKLRFGKFYIPIPNTDSRRKALIFHDIHHITTGYKSNWKGECEIGAWEVSTGCGTYIAAWVLDLGAFALGLCIYPKATYRAFIRGRGTLNLYKHTYTQQQLLNMEITEVQAKLQLNTASDRPASVNELLAFIWWSFIALAGSLMPIAIACILIWWL